MQLNKMEGGIKMIIVAMKKAKDIDIDEVFQTSQGQILFDY